MRKRLERVHPLGWAFSLMVAYSVALVLLTGQTGYWGDGMLLVDKAFWDPLLTAYTYGARAMIRPFYTFYTITLMRLFDFNSAVVLAGAMATYTGAAWAMGWALLRAFGSRRLAVAATLLAFFAPLGSVLAFDVSRVNARLVMLFFWLSVLAWQHWAEAPRRWTLPGLPMLLLVTAHLSYESALTLLPLIVLLVFPAYWRTHRTAKWFDHLLNAGSLLASMLIATALYFYIRALYGIQSGFEGAAADSLSLSQAGNVAASYLGHLATLPTSLYRWSSGFPYSLTALLVGVVFGVSAGWLLWRTADDDAPRGWTAHPLTVVFVVVAFIVFSLMTFVLAGYSPQLSGLGERNYSAATFGWGMLLAVGALWRTPRARAVYAVFVGLLVFGWGTALAQFGLDMRAAHTHRVEIYQSHYDLASALTPDTVVLYLNADWLYNDNVTISTHVGMTDYFRMFYQERGLLSFSPSLTPLREAVITPTTFTSDDTGTIPHERIVILGLEDGRMVHVEQITPSDGYPIDWQDGADELRSHPDRITTPTRESRFWKTLGIETE
jgi:hypothetical protein